MALESFRGDCLDRLSGHGESLGEGFVLPGKKPGLFDDVLGEIALHAERLGDLSVRFDQTLGELRKATSRLGEHADRLLASGDATFELRIPLRLISLGCRIACLRHRSARLIAFGWRVIGVGVGIAEPVPDREDRPHDRVDGLRPFPGGVATDSDGEVA